MKKIRLFEFCDQAWVPKWYHESLHKYLIFFYKTFKHHKLWTEELKLFLETDSNQYFLECCAGSGKCLPMILDEMNEPTLREKKFILTDLFPREESVVYFKNSQKFQYYAHPVNAAEIPDHLNYSRIFINSFHHLPPEVVKKILVRSIQQNQKVLILEYVSQSFMAYFLMLLGPIVIFTTLPFVLKGKNFWWTALFTYMFPLFPLMVLWDGLVSCKRNYTKEELEDILTENLASINITVNKRKSGIFPAEVSSISIEPNSKKATNVA